MIQESPATLGPIYKSTGSVLVSPPRIRKSMLSAAWDMGHAALGPVACHCKTDRNPAGGGGGKRLADYP